MQKTKTINNKKYTAQNIVALPNMLTKGEDFRTITKDIDIVWNYRYYQINDPFFAPVCKPEFATAIRCERMDTFEIFWLEI